MNEPGFYKGKHYTDYVEDVKALKRQGQYNEAIQLLLALIDAVELEARIKKWAIAPWYYEQLAILYRKQKDYQSEISILERFALNKHAPGVKPQQILDRLTKARSLFDSQQ
jgi:tetratricopeptide (TPR) repeat protein